MRLRTAKSWKQQESKIVAWSEPERKCRSPERCEGCSAAMWRNVQLATTCKSHVLGETKAPRYIEGPPAPILQSRQDACRWIATFRDARLWTARSGVHCSRPRRWTLDHLRSVRVIVNRDGDVIEQYNYSPFELCWDRDNPIVNKSLYHRLYMLFGFNSIILYIYWTDLSYLKNGTKFPIGKSCIHQTYKSLFS